VPVDIHNMRSEVSIQSPAETPAPQSRDSNTGHLDPEQLRDAIRDVVLEIVGDDIYTLFRTRGRR
jgi:hypothetical protein